jgi:hypothetical protein
MSKPNLADAALWTGRHQAFALIAGKCTLAQAQCLRELRQTRAHEAYGLTWAQFCARHTGMTRAAADRLIQRLNQFGAAYFKLSQLVPVSGETYRQLAPHIHGDTLEINGAKLELIPENASAIRAAVQSLRDELRALHLEGDFRRVNMTELHDKLDEILNEFRRRARHPQPEDMRANLAALLRYTIQRMQLVHREFDRPPV